MKFSALFYIGVGYLVLLLGFAIVAPRVTHGVQPSNDLPYYAMKVAKPNVAPGAGLPLGSDQQGRDIVARLGVGGLVSLFIGFSVQLASVAIGLLFGVVAVFGPPWIRNVILRLTDGMFAFPDILLGILIIGIWGPGFFAVLAALTITSWPSVVRLVKTQVATLKDREYVIAAKSLGASTPYLVWKHILPQLTGILLAVSMVDLAGIIISESTLSYLGIGVQPPTPSWGSMLVDARTDMQSHPVQLIWPCVILSLTIIAFNFVGDGLRTYFDPKSRTK